ncbi:uncharacterized protein LOC142345712 isoform X2 [Convolutriloba macropyga]|uniref:uncharacterized protein LOC142345712 isoform X2 n=1 Tax=Convolutriloba macropyga TaxID=536237 RepID=UPI003F524623
MNIDSIGRIRQSQLGEGPHSLQISQATRVFSHLGGVSHNFGTLYKQDANNYEIYKRSVEPLVELCISGFNCAFVTFGESQSGKSFTLSGENVHKQGLVTLAIDGLFSRLSEEFGKDTKIQANCQVLISMVEVYNEKVRDLFTIPKMQTDFLKVVETADEGFAVQSLQKAIVNSSGEATRAFRDGWGRRTQVQTDYGLSHTYSSVIFQIEVSLVTRDNPAPNRSRLVFVDLPAAEKLIHDSQELRLREGPTLNKGLFALSRMVGNIANEQKPERVIDNGDSKLSQLLMDVMSGNCKTTVMTCLRPHCDPSVLATILRVSTHFSRCRTFPIMNDAFGQGLEMQYRSRILRLQEELGLVPESTAGKPDVQSLREETKRVKNENLHLRDKNERLYSKLESLQTKLNDIAVSKRDISSNYVLSEEEKLKVSKALVDLQIENNRLKEDTEQTKFDQTNKSLLLESQLMEAQMDRERLQRTTKDAVDKLEEVEKSRKLLADEFVSLKANYMALAKDYDTEVARNEELTTELLTILNTKEMMLRDRTAPRATVSGLTPPKLALPVGPDSYDLAQAELDRIRTLLNRMSAKKLDTVVAAHDNALLAEDDRIRLEKSIFGDVERFNKELERIRIMYDDEQKQLEHRLQALAKDLDDARQASRTAQKKMAETASELYQSRQTNKELESENNRLQNKLKDLNEEYKSRLVRYVDDIAEYIDSTRSQNEKNIKLKAYMEAMMKDIKRASHTREEQLTDAVKKYKGVAKTFIKRHEELLVAYRLLRTQIINLGYDIDLGPDQFDLYINDADLKLDQQNDLAKLSRALKEAHEEIRKLKEGVSTVSPKTSTQTKLSSTTRRGLNDEMDEARQSLRDFSRNQLLALEAEKAALLARATVAEEQLQETQEYIDKHLTRYKDEIMRLRRLLGDQLGASHMRVGETAADVLNRGPPPGAGGGGDLGPPPPRHSPPLRY